MSTKRADAAPGPSVARSMYVFSDDPPPDLCDWAHVRQAPGPGTYHPNFDHVKQSTLRSDFAPPIHWPDGDGESFPEVSNAEIYFIDSPAYHLCAWARGASGVNVKSRDSTSGRAPRDPVGLAISEYSLRARARAGIPAGDLLRKYRNPTRRELFTSGSEMRSLLRESLRPSAQRAMSAASGTHSTHLPTLPRANFSTLKNDLPVRPVPAAQLVVGPTPLTHAIPRASRDRLHLTAPSIAPCRAPPTSSREAGTASITGS